jgi:hypothetical protein
MGDVQYPNDEAIISHVCDRLSRMSSEVPSPLPSREQVAAMLSAAFAASLESEEGRPVTFNLFYAPNNYPINYRFREPAPLSAGALVRLSAGLDHLKTSVAINGELKDLRIVGLWHGGNAQLGLFAIQVVGVGVFVVKYAAKLVLTYRRGQYVPYPGTFDSVNDAGLLLTNPTPRYPRGSREAHAVRCRFRIAEEMLRIGHGGTLLVVPHDAEWEPCVASHRFPPASPEGRVLNAEAQDYAMWMRRQAAFQVLSHRRLKKCRIKEPTRTALAGHLVTGYSYRENLAAELDAVARLTATDGMVLILPNLTILGFGVFFVVADLDCAIELHDPYERAPETFASLSRLGGARHQSAAVAAARLPGALAVVVSSDGTVTTMRRPDEHHSLVVHKHLELRMPQMPFYQ